MTRLLPAVLALAAAGSMPADTAGQVFKATVDGVAVDVLVTRDRRPVTGLTTADFTLRDNGVPQRIQSVMLEDVPVNLLLVLDTSGSVEGDLLGQLKSAARAAAASLRPIDRVGLFVFNDRVRLVLEPPAAVSALWPHLDALKASGETSIYDATFAALTIREGVPGRMLVLVFSDGDDTSSWLDPREVLAVAQRSDVVVHAVVVGSLYQVTPLTPPATMLQRLFAREPHLYRSVFLTRLIEETGGSLQEATSAGLQEAFVRVVNEYRSRYVLTYVPDGVAASGWHDVDVAVQGRGMRVQARRGYLR